MDQISSHFPLQILSGPGINCWRHTVREVPDGQWRREKITHVSPEPISSPRTHPPPSSLSSDGTTAQEQALLPPIVSPLLPPTVHLWSPGFWFKHLHGQHNCIAPFAWYVTPRSLEHTPQTLSDSGMNSSARFTCSQQLSRHSQGREHWHRWWTL